MLNDDEGMGGGDSGFSPRGHVMTHPSHDLSGGASSVAVPNNDDDPLLYRVQQNLQNNLTKQLERLELALKEAEAEASAGSKERETVGVEVWGLQQNLEKLENEIGGREAEISALETQAIEVLDANATAEAEHAALSLQVQKDDAELDALYVQINKTGAALRTVAQSAAELEGASAAERAAVIKERKLLGQGLSEAERAQRWEARLRAELTAEEGRAARVAAHRAALETEAETLGGLAAEARRRVMTTENDNQHARRAAEAAVVQVARRDEALRAVEAELATLEVAEQEAGNEIRAAQGDVADGAARLEKADKMLSGQRRAIEVLQSDKLALARSCTDLEARLEVLGGESAALESQVKAKERAAREAETHMALLGKALEGARRELRITRDAVAKFGQDTRVTHASQSAALSEVAALQARIAGAEARLAELQNELQRTKLANLALLREAEHLEDGGAALDREIAAGEAAAAAEAADERALYRKIDQRQKTVDRLNKVIAEAQSAHGTPALSPLQNAIENLKRELRSVAVKTAEAQGAWLQRQNQVLAVRARVEAQTAETRSCGAALARNEQLNDKNEQELEGLAKACATLANEAAEFERQEGTLTRELARLNAQYRGFLEKSEQRRVQTEEKLTEANARTLEMEQQLDKGHAELDDLNTALNDAEKELIFWKMKVDAEALLAATARGQDGSAKAVLADLAKQVHRLQNQLLASKREKEQVYAELDKTLDKHSTLQNKQIDSVLVENPRAIATAKRQIETLQKARKEALAIQNDLQARLQSVATAVEAKQAKAAALLDQAKTAQESAIELEGQLSVARAAAAREKARGKLVQRNWECVKAPELRRTSASAGARRAANNAANTPQHVQIADIVQAVAEQHPPIQLSAPIIVDWLRQL